MPAIVAARVDALDAGEPDRVAALNADDAVVGQAVHGGDDFRGRADVAARVADDLGGGPDLMAIAHAGIVEDDRFAWALVRHGARAGQHPVLSTATAGRSGGAA